MILTCPECSTRYLIKENAIGPNGRTVRCAKCETTWFVASEADELALKDNQSSLENIVPETASAAAVTASKTSFQADHGIAQDSPKRSVETIPTPIEKPGAHVVMRDKADRERRRRRLTSVGLIWAVPLALLFVASIFRFVFRQEIVNGVPQTATLYKSLGVDVKLSGLNIEDPITRSALVDGQPVLVVNGAVRNITTQDQAVPMVEFSLHSKDGEPLVTWLVDVNKKQLAKNERVTFVSEYPNPPVDAVKLRYKFANETAAAESSGAPVDNVMSVVQ